MSIGMKKILLIVTLCALALLLAGCSDKDGGASSAAKAKKSEYPIDNLPATSVVMRVNGQDITQADYASWYRLREKIYRATYRLSPTETSDQTRNFIRDNRARMIGELLRRELMRQEADRLGVTVPEENIRRLEKRFMATIRRKDEPFDKVDKLFGTEDAKALRKTLYMDARDVLCLEKATTNDLKNVSDQELDGYIERARKWNEEAEKKMAVQRERAMKAREEILNGGIFATVTSNRADLAKDDGGVWQSWTIAEAMEESEALAKWLLTAKIGDISEPIDFEDGLAIVGLKYIDEEGLAEEGKEPEKEYELVRCTFFAYDKLEDFEDRKELAEDILKERRKDALRELGMRLMTAAKVEFPLGDGIFRKRPPKKKAKKSPAVKKPKDPSRVKKASAAKQSPSATNAALQVQGAAPPVDLKK